MNLVFISFSLPQRNQVAGVPVPRPVRTTVFPRSRQALICGTFSRPAPSKNGGMPIRDIRISCEKRWNSNVFQTFPFAFRGDWSFCWNGAETYPPSSGVQGTSCDTPMERLGCSQAVRTGGFDPGRRVCSAWKGGRTTPVRRLERGLGLCEFDAGECIGSVPWNAGRNGRVIPMGGRLERIRLIRWSPQIWWPLLSVLSSRRACDPFR